MSMTKIKLVGNAKLFWKTIVSDVDLTHHPLIFSRDEMCNILKNKYIPNHYMDDWLNQFINLKQDTSTIAE